MQPATELSHGLRYEVHFVRAALNVPASVAPSSPVTRTDASVPTLTLTSTGLVKAAPQVPSAGVTVMAAGTATWRRSPSATASSGRCRCTSAARCEPVAGTRTGHRSRRSGRQPSAREIPRAASRTAGARAGTWAPSRGTTTDTAATTSPSGPRTAAATDSASSVT